MAWAKTTSRREEKHLSFWIWCGLYYMSSSKFEFHPALAFEGLTPIGQWTEIIVGAR